MYFRFRRTSRTLAAAGRVAGVLAAGVAAFTATAGATAATPSLRVCADPNNLPFSDRAGRGFENALAELVARKLGRQVEYTWFPQRRGFVRNTLDAGDCDVIMGVPASYELAQPTHAYYASTYVFVSRARDGRRIDSFDDPQLRALRIGVPVVGDDYSSTPGAVALGRRGLITNMVGFSIYGDYSQPHPPSRIIDAVADDRIDIAFAWGPLAGYFADKHAEPLQLTPVESPDDGSDTPFVYAISMAVRPADEDLLRELNAVIAADRDEIHAVLARFGVPLVELPDDERTTR